MKIDRDALEEAWQRHYALDFPECPVSEDLGNWQMELAELGGYIAGLAQTARGTPTAGAINSMQARNHAQRLARIRVADEDDQIYRYSRTYIETLVRLEDVLSGRAPAAD